MNRFERNRERFIDFTAEHSDALCAVLGFMFGLTLLYVAMYLNAVY